MNWLFTANLLFLQGYIMMKLSGHDICKSLKGRGVNTGLRLVYVYFEEKGEIVFVELYHKNEKEIEDRERISKFLLLQ